MADDSAERPIAAAPGRRLWRAGLWSLLFGGLLAAATFVAYRGRAEFGDEGSFCTIGQGILGGRLPYRDLFNEKPSWGHCGGAQTGWSSLASWRRPP